MTRKGAYRVGDIVREIGGEVWTVVEDEGTDPGGQILFESEYGERVYLTRKPGRFRRIGRAADAAKEGER